MGTERMWKARLTDQRAHGMSQREQRRREGGRKEGRSGEKGREGT